MLSGTALSTCRFISSSVTKANCSAILTIILMWDLNPWSRFQKLGNIIGEYPRIFPSFSWGIFVHVTRLDQSRARENIWWIIKTDMHLKKGGPEVFQIYPNAIHFNPLQFCPFMSLHGFPVFCLRSAIGFSRYRDILVNSMPIWSVLKLPKIAWPTPFNLSFFPCIH